MVHRPGAFWLDKDRESFVTVMSTKRASQQFWIKVETGSWGPMDWKLLREWLALGWLPPEVLVGEDRSGPWQSAQAFPKLWKGTQSTAKRIEEFEIADLESEKLPISPALRSRIAELGWPGDVERLRNYYWGNRLREALENLFPDPERAPFDDPDWPRCWSVPSPAEARLQESARLSEPITPAQDEALTFFLGKDHGVATKIEASEKLTQILEDPENEARWEEQRSKVPATERQQERLRWWAKQLGHTVPSPLSKATASRLIDEWLEENPELEDEWYDLKSRQEEKEFENIDLVHTADDVNEWREFYDCKRVSRPKVKAVLAIIGARDQSEPIDRFMSRFFTELRRIDPALFVPRVVRQKSPRVPKSGCLVLLAGLALLAITTVSAAAWALLRLAP